MWKRWAGTAGVAGLLGCSTVTLRDDPFGGHPTPRLQPAFTVDWWQPLVHSPLLEYVPRETATPALDVKTGQVIALTRDGWVRALGEGGAITWSFKTAAPFIAGALADPAAVYVPGGDGTLYALDPNTGQAKWRYSTGEALATVPVRAGELILVASESDTLFAVNASTGALAWQYRRDPPLGFTIYGVSSPVVRGDVLYRGSSGGAVVALQVADGTVRWEKQLATSGGPFGDVDTTPVFDEAGRMYMASYRDGLFSLNPETGDLLWRTPTAGITSLIGRGDVLFAAGDQRVDAYHAATGKLLWTRDIPGRAAQAPLLTRQALLVPTQRALLFLDPATGRSRLRWNPGDGVTATPRLAQAHVYVLSNLGYLYSMQLEGQGG